MQDIQGFLAHFRRQRGWTRALIEAIPEEHFDWRPAADAFSLGDTVRHLIQAEIFWRKLLLGAARGEPYDPFRFEGDSQQRMDAFRERNLEVSHDTRFGDSFAACLETWRPIQADTEARLAEITSEQLTTVRVPHPLLVTELPLWEMVLVMIAHEGHHRGQMSGFLKSLGVAQPSIFGR